MNPLYFAPTELAALISAHRSTRSLSSPVTAIATIAKQWNFQYVKDRSIIIVRVAGFEPAPSDTSDILPFKLHSILPSFRNVNLKLQYYEKHTNSFHKPCGICGIEPPQPRQLYRIPLRPSRVGGG